MAPKTPSKAQRESLESAVSRSARKELLEACKEFGVSASRKDSTARICDKVRRTLLIPQDDEEEEDEEPPAAAAIVEKKEEAPVLAPVEEKEELPLLNAEWKPSFFLSCTVLIVLVIAILIAPKPRSAHPKSSIIRSAGFKAILAEQDDDTRESLKAFAQGWESARRRHAVSLLLVGRYANTLAEKIAVGLAPTVESLLLTQGVDGAKATENHFRHAAEDQSFALVIADLDSTEVNFAEHLIDPYLNLPLDAYPPLDHTAFIFTFESTEDACASLSTDRPTAARLSLSSSSSLALPTAFYNRIQHAALLCSSS